MDRTRSNCIQSRGLWLNKDITYFKVSIRIFFKPGLMRHIIVLFRRRSRSFCLREKWGENIEYPVPRSFFASPTPRKRLLSWLQPAERCLLLFRFIAENRLREKWGENIEYLVPRSFFASPTPRKRLLSWLQPAERCLLLFRFISEKGISILTWPSLRQEQKKKRKLL